MEIYDNAHYVGRFNGFNYVAVSAVNSNSVIVAGNLIGITRRAFAVGETVQAFLAGEVSVYNFELASTAAAAVTQGTAIYINSSGKATTTASGNTLIGCLWQAVAVGDTYAAVVIFGPCADMATTNQAALVSPTADSVTDNSGGTAATTIAAIGATYAQADVANAVASLAAQIAKLKADTAALIAALKTAGLMATA